MTGIKAKLKKNVPVHLNRFKISQDERVDEN
jgi:hypothetical protein